MAGFHLKSGATRFACLDPRFAVGRSSPRRVFASVIAVLGLAACSHPAAQDSADAIYNAAETTLPLSPGTRPVRVGEGGAAFPACAGVGRVVNISPAGERYLSVRAAPFSEAAEVARLDEGAQLFLCTRSIDQQWQGVVVPAIGNADCGVAAPTAHPHAYDGSCRSGWVSNAFVRLVAG